MTRRPTLPRNHDAEASVLGGLFYRNEILRQLADLEVEDFDHPKHQAVFSAIRNLEATATPIDPITVQNELLRQGKLESIGGLAFLAELSLRVPSLDNILHYAEIVVKHRVTRDLVLRLSEVIDRVMDDREDELEGEAAVQWASSEIKRINTRSRGRSISIGSIVVGRMRELSAIEDRRANGENVLTGAPTGIAKLDEKLGGHQFGILTYIGGRVRMGKTAVLMATANASSAAGIGVHAFNLEDTRSSYADRSIATIADVPVSSLSTALLHRDEYESLHRGVANLRQRQGWIYDDRAALTVAEIVASVRRDGERNGTRVVVVDYVQLIKPADRRAPRHEQLDQISTDLMTAAKEDDCAYVVGAQIGRGAMDRQGGRPTLEDLKGSGGLEEKCKCAILVHRGSVYGDPVEGVDWDPAWEGRTQRPDDHEWQTRVELLIAKRTSGKEGDAWGYWQGPFTRIS